MKFFTKELWLDVQNTDPTNDTRLRAKAASDAYRAQLDTLRSRLLSALDALDRLVWRVSYKTVRRAVVDYPSEHPLFYQDGNASAKGSCGMKVC